MKWKDHIRIIRAATQKQHVPAATYRGLLAGVIYPDKTNSWRKEHGKLMESHHNPDNDKIMNLIWQARRFWLNGRENDAGFQLGQALHYIHDGLISKGFIGLFHDSNERKIQTLDIHENIIESAMKDSKSDPFYVEDLLQRVSSQGPEKAFETATYITASLIRTVFNHQSIPDGLKDEHRNVHIQRSNYRKAGIIGGAILLLTSIFDSGYYRIEKKWKWFNIKD